MTTQLKQKGIDDRRFKYNADGVVKASDFSASEILLTEISSGFNLNDKRKTSFDHLQNYVWNVGCHQNIGATL